MSAMPFAVAISIVLGAVMARDTFVGVWLCLTRLLPLLGLLLAPRLIYCSVCVAPDVLLLRAH